MPMLLPQGKSPGPQSSESAASSGPATQRTEDTSRRMASFMNCALPILQQAIDLVSEAAGDAAVPGLSIGLSALAAILEQIQIRNKTSEGANKLQDHVIKLSEIITDFYSRPQALPEETKRRIEMLSQEWTDVAERMKCISSRSGWLKRILLAKSDAEELEGLVDDINNSIQQNFLLGSLLSIEEGMHGLCSGVQRVQNDVGNIAEGVNTVQGDMAVAKEGVAALLEDVAEVNEGVVAMQGDVGKVNEGVLEITEGVAGIKDSVQVLVENVQMIKAYTDDSFMPIYAKGAQFDASNVRRECLDGTRMSILEALRQWIINTCLQRVLGIAHIIYWINGLAGTGKTTIAFSIAQWCSQEGILGASFFCSRFDAECSNPNSVFRTISRQLCHFSAPFKKKIVAILEKNPTLVNSGVSRQFEELILRPLEELGSNFRRCVVVIDALDECEDESMTSTILSIIAKFLPRIAPFIVFIITSRPERRIACLFDSSAGDTLKDAHTSLLLHMIELKKSVLDDIRLYLEKKFVEVRGIFMIKDWPSSLEVSGLAELSDGLFIWAATAIRFIMDEEVCDPVGQLQALLSTQSALQSTQPTSQSTEWTPTTILDALYGQISNASLHRISVPLANRLQHILGTIVLAQEPLSVATLGRMTNTEVVMIRSTLIGLHSVLHIPSDDDEPIRIIHPTFAEFLLSPSSKPKSFSINADAQHAYLFSRTLEIVANLKPSIADDMEGPVMSHMSYSCRYWGVHLEQCHDAGRIVPTLHLLDRFFGEHFLRWLEACGLLEALDGSVAALHTAHKVCQRHGEPYLPLAEFISDCLRFTQTNAVRINAAPSQVYHSLVALAPNASPMKRLYAGKLEQSLLVIRGAPSDWGPCLDMFTGHSGHRILSVSFSRDGAYFATGGDDRYIRIWKAATRTLVTEIVTDNHCYDVALSPDGTHIASVKSLRIWNVKLGKLVRTLDHADASKVAYSAGGTRVASSYYTEIKLWDSSNWICLATIESVLSGLQVAISPNGALVGGCVDDSPALYHVSSGRVEVLEAEDGEEVVAFSSDGRYAANRNRVSNTLKIWALKDDSPVSTIHLPADIWHVAFSNDSTQIGCACADGHVRIWTIGSDDPHVFSGHTGLIYSLAWSLDDTQIVSGGHDGTIRVWDTTYHHDIIPTPPQLPSLAVLYVGNCVRSFFAQGLIGAIRWTVLHARSSLKWFRNPPPERLLTGQPRHGKSTHCIPHSTSPRYAALHPEDSIALLSSLAHSQPFAATSDITNQLHGVTFHADLADAWDEIFYAFRPHEYAVAQSWAFLTGILHVNVDLERPVAWSPNRTFIASRPPGSPRGVQILNSETGNILTLFRDDVDSFTFSPDSARLATTHCFKETLAVWDITSSTQPLRPSREFKVVGRPSRRAVAFSHDGNMIVAGRHGSCSVLIYDAVTGQDVTLRGTRGEFDRIAFSVDDRHVVAQNGQWTLVWDVTTGDLVCEFTSDHDGLMRSFDFALDDTGILVPDGNGRTIKVSLWQPGDRPWPVYTVTKDGWLYGKSPGKMQRLCCLPPEWRLVCALGGPRVCSPDVNQKRAVVFDVSRLPEYIQTWGDEFDTGQ